MALDDKTLFRVFRNGGLTRQVAQALIDRFGASSGGSSPAPADLPRAAWAASSQSVSNAGANLTWNPTPNHNWHNGASLLDFTDPANPTFISGGIYAVTLRPNRVDAALPGQHASIELDLDANAADPNIYADGIDLGAVQSPTPLVLIAYVPAGGAMYAYISHDNADPVNFSAQLYVQALALDPV